MQDIRQARKQGSSVVLTMTGFLEENKYYGITEQDDGTITISEVEFKKKETNNK